MSGGEIAGEEVRLNERCVHRLGAASSHDQVLFVHQSATNRLDDALAHLEWCGGSDDLHFFEVEPAEDLFRPEFEREQQLQVPAVSEC